MFNLSSLKKSKEEIKEEGKIFDKIVEEEIKLHLEKKKGESELWQNQPSEVHEAMNICKWNMIIAIPVYSVFIFLARLFNYTLLGLLLSFLVCIPYALLYVFVMKSWRFFVIPFFCWIPSVLIALSIFYLYQSF